MEFSIENIENFMYPLQLSNSYGMIWTWLIVCGMRVFLQR